MRNPSGFLICHNVLLDRNGAWPFFKKVRFFGYISQNKIIVYMNNRVRTFSLKKKLFAVRMRYVWPRPGQHIYTHTTKYTPLCGRHFLFWFCLCGCTDMADSHEVLPLKNGEIPQTRSNLKQGYVCFGSKTGHHTLTD